MPRWLIPSAIVCTVLGAALALIASIHLSVGNSSQVVTGFVNVLLMPPSEPKSQIAPVVAVQESPAAESVNIVDLAQQTQDLAEQKKQLEQELLAESQKHAQNLVVAFPPGTMGYLCFVQRSVGIQDDNEDRWAGVIKPFLDEQQFTVTISKNDTGYLATFSPNEYLAEATGSDPLLFTKSGYAVLSSHPGRTYPDSTTEFRFTGSSRFDLYYNYAGTYVLEEGTCQKITP